MKSKSSKSSSNANVDLPSVKDLLEAGAHFGHETKRWNPNYREFIFSQRGNFHIIDLEKTLEYLKEALKYLKESASKGEVLFVGTKRQARDIIKDEAIRCGAHFVTNRWVGGQLTNYDKVKNSINRLLNIEKKLNGDLGGISQQRLSVLRREWGRLERLFGGVKFMETIPSAIVIVDPLYERIALKESKVANVPIVALIDSNTSPKGIDYPVPGNDDAIKSIKLFIHTLADAILLGNKGKGVKHKFYDFSRVGVNAESDKKKTKEKEQ